MKKSAVVVLMLVLFAGSAFAGEACKNRSKSGLLSSTNVVDNGSTSGSSTRGSK